VRNLSGKNLTDNMPVVNTDHMLVGGRSRKVQALIRGKDKAGKQQKHNQEMAKGMIQIGENVMGKG